MRSFLKSRKNKKTDKSQKNIENEEDESNNEAEATQRIILEKIDKNQPTNVYINSNKCKRVNVENG